MQSNRGSRAWMHYPRKHFDTSDKSAAPFHHRAICKTAHGTAHRALGAITGPNSTQLERVNFYRTPRMFLKHQQAIQYPCASTQLFRDTILRCISRFQVAAQAEMACLDRFSNNRPSQSHQRRCLLVCSRRSLLPDSPPACLRPPGITARSIQLLNKLGEEVHLPAIAALRSIDYALETCFTAWLHILVLSEPY
jgi:hypothetical protein